MIAHLDDGKANALSFEIIESLRDAVAEASADETVGALVIHGRPGKFSAGFDLNVMRGGDMGRMITLVADGGDLVRDCFGASVPVIAASTGHALAAGALLLLGCDVRIGADGPFQVGLPEVNIGMSLPRWSITIANERLSQRHRLRATANGRITGPAESVDVGFLDEVVDGDAVLDRAVELATQLAGAMDARAYAQIVIDTRGAALDLMAEQIAADRAAAA